MDKRFALALGLSLLIWVVWLWIFKPLPEQPRRVQEAAQTQQKKADQPAGVPQAAGAGSVAAAQVVPEQTAEDELEIPVTTDRYQVKLSNRGATISALKYLYNGREIDLVASKKNLDKYGFAATSGIDFSVYQTENEFQNGAGLDRVLWSHEKTSGNSVKFSAKVRTFQGSPIVFERVYTFHKDKLYFELQQTMKNAGRAPVQLPNNYLIATTGDFLGPDMDFANSYNRVESAYYLDDDFERGSQGGGLFSSEQDNVRVNGQVKWVGMMSRYFLMLMVPQGFTGTGVIHEGRAKHGNRTGMYITTETLQPGKVVEKAFKVYVGEKNKEKLVAVDPVLRDAADVNAFIEPIRDFLVWCLMKINLLFGNLGWSLIIFSIITKIILMPLTLKSTESMKRMQELSPKIKEIQTKYKEKPEVMNKKVMELYKKEKVNPLSGCLPLLLQMPFFFALYSALINSIDLWQAPFIFWITDLSMPDTVATISGFNINILPVLMTATTYFQQKMTPGSDSSQQQMMMKIMPFLFLFIFWNMPSGLVLYWIMQNVLQILHQLYINSRPKKEAA
jgi:YidC/Oxa1 family membrane protein insertase